MSECRYLEELCQFASELCQFASHNLQLIYDPKHVIDWDVLELEQRRIFCTCNVHKATPILFEKVLSSSLSDELFIT